MQKKNIHENAATLRRITCENRVVNHLTDENLFISNYTKESTYLLGFIWGDGYINNSGTNNQVRIECVSEDVETIKPILEKTGKWKYYVRKRVNKKRQVTTALTSNKDFVNFLIEYDYKNKSNVAPNKILDRIPNELKKYFMLGWIDADGCFYWNGKRKQRQFYLSGSYEQDWGTFETQLNELHIKYNIQRIQNKTKYSCIRITNKQDIQRLGEFIYDDLIPFKRKHDKYLQIIK